MKFNFFSLASFVTFLFFNSIIADDSNTTCPQDYNLGTELFQCGPENPPCVSLLNEGRFNNFPNTPLNCDETNKICQYPNDSILSVVCPQGTIDIYWASDNSTFISNANNIFAYYLSNQCSQNPHSIHSTQNGDTLVVDCDPLKNSNGSPCTNDYNYNRNISDSQPAFECGLEKADCVTLEGSGGVIIQSPNKADACDPFDRFCSFPHNSELTVQCDQGTITAQFSGTQNTFQNHAPNSIAYWMSNKCTGPSNSLSTQDGDLLVVNCDPFFPFGPTN